MTTIHNRVELEASPGKVFELMADHTRYPDWLTVTDEVRLVTGDHLRAGTEYEEISQFGPKRVRSRWRVTEFEPPRRQVHRGELPFGPLEVRIEIEPDGEGGALLDHTVKLTALPRFRPLGWLLERLILGRRFDAEMKESLGRFTEMIEGDARTERQE